MCSGWSNSGGGTLGIHDKERALLDETSKAKKIDQVGSG